MLIDSKRIRLFGLSEDLTEVNSVSLSMETDDNPFRNLLARGVKSMVKEANVILGGRVSIGYSELNEPVKFIF